MWKERNSNSVVKRSLNETVETTLFAFPLFCQIQQWPNKMSTTTTRRSIPLRTKRRDTSRRVDVWVRFSGNTSWDPLIGVKGYSLCSQKLIMWSNSTFIKNNKTTNSILNKTGHLRSLRCLTVLTEMGFRGRLTLLNYGVYRKLFESSPILWSSIKLNWYDKLLISSVWNL